MVVLCIAVAVPCAGVASPAQQAVGVSPSQATNPTEELTDAVLIMAISQVASRLACSASHSTRLLIISCGCDLAA
jgi:hypothetical protein